MRRSPTDHISEYTPPANTPPKVTDATKFNSLSRSHGWAPKPPHAPNHTRAVYNPIAHTTSLYTYGDGGSVSSVEGHGDALLKQARDASLERGSPWYGRRKGVVEFVDQTATYAVNQNDAFVANADAHPHFAARINGEMSHWFDVAIKTGSKIPFRNNG